MERENTDTNSIEPANNSSNVLQQLKEAFLESKKSDGTDITMAMVSATRLLGRKAIPQDTVKPRGKFGFKLPWQHIAPDDNGDTAQLLCHHYRDGLELICAISEAPFGAAIIDPLVLIESH